MMLALCAPRLSAAEPSSEEAAEELLGLIGSEKRLRASFLAGMTPLFTKMKNSGVSEEKIREVKAAGEEFADKIIEDPEFARGRLSVYTEVFSRDELVALVEFYRSPVGQKALVKMPEITRDRAATVQEVLKRYQPKFNERVKEIMSDTGPGADPASSN